MCWRADKQSLPFLLDNSISFWHTLMILHTCIKREPRWTSVDFEVKSLGHILSLNFVPFPHGGPISFWHILWWYDGVKGKGYICVYFMFELLFPYCYSFWHTFDTSHMCFLWAKEDLYLFLGQAVMVNLECLNLLPRGGGDGVPLKHVNFKWMWLGSRLNDIYVYTLPALVYSLRHDQTVLKRTYQWKFEPIRCDGISNIFLKVFSWKCGTQWRI